MKTYDNFKELQKEESKIAIDLLDEFGSGAWQDEEITVFYNQEEYAKYELEEGWYSEVYINRNYNGAPNLIDFIDLDSLGESLKEAWDDNMYKELDNNRIVMTSYGW